MPTKARILYAEDDPGLARLVQRRLEHHGFEIWTVRSGPEAISLLKTQHFDIVITDYGMSGEDGLELIRAVKAAFPDLPLVMMSGMGDLKIAVEAMKLGAADYVIKDAEGSYLDLLPLAVLRIVEQQRLAQEKIRTEQALSIERALSRLAFDSISQGVCIFDENLVLQLCNEQFLKCCEYPARLGTPGTSLEAMLRFNAARGDYGPNPTDAVIEAKLERTRKSQDFKYERKNSSGAIFEVCSHSMPNKGFVVTYTDVTERKTNEQRIWLQAHYDALTGLANRSLFHELLKRHVLQTQRTGHTFGLLFIDLDGFKEVNDTHGHDKGDLLLKVAAGRLQQVVRESDVVARLGGDEFTVILPNVRNEENAAHVAEKILNALSRPYGIDDIEIEISASIGVLLCPIDVASGDELLRKADSAMYAAKREGKRRVKLVHQLVH